MLGSLSFKEKIQLAGIALFLSTISFSREINQVFYGIFIITSLPLCSYTLWKERRNIILAFCGIYFVAVISTFYAPDLKLAFATLGLQIALLLTPVILGISYVPSKLKNLAIKIFFVAGVCAALIYLLIIFLLKVDKEQVSLMGSLSQQNLNHQYSSPIGIHASFFSSYVAVCASFLLEFLLSAKKWINRIFFFLLFMLCILSLLLLSSRMVLSVYGFCLVLFIFLSPKPAFWPGKVIIAGCLAVALFTFIHLSNYFKTRFDQDIQKDLKWNEWTALTFDYTATKEKQLLKNDGSRIERWIAAIQLIRRKPWTGYGTGQEKPMLFKEYTDLGLTVTLEKGYDAHNQFLSVLIKSGIWGLIALLLLLITGFTLAFRAGNLTYISFLLIITAVCLVENYLNANKGVFFFAFFNTFFAIMTISRKE